MTMERLHSWISPAITHALGWALIHSLWQCVGIAALAALLMAFSRRSSFRYLVAVGALALIIAAPIATFIVLMRPAVPVQAVLGPSPSPLIAAAPATADAYPVAVLSSASSRAVAAITASPRRAALPDMLPWLVAAWLFGVTLLSLRLAGGFLLLEQKRRKLSGALSPRILAICEELQQKLGLHRAIRYQQCDWLQAPAVIGWVRPIVFLPVAALTGLSELQLRAVIAHELAHIRRFDAFVNLFQILVETLLFYHPAVWWLNKRIRAERELCCDEIAVSLSGSRLEYAQALTLMAELEKTPFLAMAVNRGPLSERVLHIMGRKSVGAGSRMLGLTGSILLLAAGLFAANALFGIAYPIPAQARASVTAVLVSGQTAVDRIAREVLQPGEPAAQITVPEQITRNDETAPSAQTEVVKNIQPDKLVVAQPDLSRLVPAEPPATPALVASNPPPAAASRDVPAQAPRNDQDITPAKSGPNEPRIKATCFDVPNNSVTGRVVSSKAIELHNFSCRREEQNGLPLFYVPGPCKNTLVPRSCENRFPLTMNVELADPADASKMHPGALVTLKGIFRVYTQNNVDYLFVQEAKVLHGDPFVPDRHSSNDAPASTMASNAPPAEPTQGEPTVRKTLMAASSLALLAGASQVGAQSNDVPTGTRDPDALTCNAPELVPLAKAVNWRICLQNSLVATLGEDGGLRLGGTAVRSYSDLPISELPTGEGDPNGVTCQEPQLLTGTRWRGPIACAHNAFWAKLAAGGCVLTPSARSIIFSPTSKKWNTLACVHMKGRNGLLPRVFF
jgi:beta-lactamase regulating signal transducer with metallopeptidase domain